MSSPLRVDRLPGRVALLVLDRADQLNALSSDVAASLAEAVADLTEDDSVRSIVIAGEGRAFSAGADITELGTLDGPEGFAAFVHQLTDAFDLLAGCPKPSVAAIHGVAYGGGCELALACDLRVMGEGARLGVPEIKLGLLPGAAGTARLARMLPAAIAKQLLLTGEPISAADALRLGLVNQVVSDTDVREAAVALAIGLAGRPAAALAAGKHLVDHGGELPLADAIHLERETVAGLFGTADGIEGVAAFLEKRSPSFG